MKVRAPPGRCNTAHQYGSPSASRCDPAMRIPAVTGLIRRRILVNYRVDPDVLQRVLPTPFRVQRVADAGIAGICLISLEEERPRFLPRLFGYSSENAAHRIAVEWDTPQGVQQGVYVPRRDTSSLFNSLVGGRLFPGEHHRATFDVTENGDDVRVDLCSRDGATRVSVEGTLAQHLPETSVFPSIEAASTFFERGAIGWSATDRRDRFECLELRSFDWRVRPLAVKNVQSSFFADTARFPAGSTQFDCALLMRDIRHEWHAHAPLVGRS